MQLLKTFDVQITNLEENEDRQYKIDVIYYKDTWELLIIIRLQDKIVAVLDNYFIIKGRADYDELFVNKDYEDDVERIIDVMLIDLVTEALKD